MAARPAAGSPSAPVAADAAVASPPAAGAQAPAEGAGGPSTLLIDGELEAARDAPVGGQAVLEGVMMRGVSHWAVAVRKPTAEQLAEGERSPEDAALGEIEVKSFPLESALRRHRVLRAPIIRGIVALGGSLAIGFRALEFSANAQLPPEGRVAEAPAASADGTAHAAEDAEPQEIPKALWIGTIVLALAFAIVLFFLIPVGLTSLIKGQLGSSVLFWLIEGLLRTAIFLGYLWLLSRMRDLRRVFEYHGAEHKTISCFEAGLALTPVNAQRFSRLHPRCGTSFLLIVMVVAIFVFAPIGLPAWYWLLLTRILGVPLIAGISFEIIKFAGKNRSRKWVQALMWPGLKLQLLTTREPDLDQLAVAIASLEAVLALEKPGEMNAEDLVGVELVA
ncbi:MAG TPA: DUF1385 domain-containing protein [Solirubrobacteraceae bacterium]|jgi:uncharacterized protein YqhQ|nr:DUF1385 domain-containing protein [Solirubrobacteraceae bacterium]